MLRGFDANRLLRPAAMAVAGALVLALAVTLVVPRLHSEQRLAQAVLLHVEAATGAKATLEGARLTVWPRPAVVLQDLDAGPVRVERAVARLSVSSLLVGRIEPVRLKLERGEVSLRGDAPALRKALDDFELPRLDLEAVRLSANGRTFVVDDGRIDHVGGVLFSTGEGRWNGRAVGWSGRIGPLARIDGGVDARIAIESGGLSFEFDGQATADALRGGTLNVRGPSLAGAVDWLDLPTTGLPALPFSLATELVPTAWGWELDETRVALGEARGEGVIGLARGAAGAPYAANGTLALGPVAVDVDALRKVARGTANDALHLDLRFSTPELRLSTARLRNVAATLRTHADGVTIGVGDAALDKGRATGALSFDRSGAGLLQTRLAGVASVSLPVPLPVGAPRPSGTVNLSADVALALDAPGDTPFEGATATGRIVLEDGTIENLDLRAVASLGRDLAAVDVTEGATAFERLDARFALADGLLELSEVRVEGSGMAVDMVGRIDLERGVPGLRGEASGVGLATTDEVSLAPRTTSFFIGGTLAKPLVVPIAASD